MGTANRLTLVVMLALVTGLVIPSPLVHPASSQIRGSSPITQAESASFIPNAYAQPSYEIQPNDANSGCEAIGGTWSSVNSTCDLNTGIPGANGNYLKIDTGVTVSNFGSIYFGTIINYGTIDNNAVGVIGSAQNFTNYGIVNNYGEVDYSFNTNSSFTNNAGATITNNAGGLIWSDGPINNHGSITNYGRIDLEGTTNNEGIINNLGKINDCYSSITGNPVTGNPVTNCPIPQSSWSNLAPTPAPVGPGASLAFAQGSVGSPTNFLFATRGGGTTDFWRYDISSNAWTSLAPTPGPVGVGGSIVEAYGYTDWVIYAMQGGNQTGFWRYDINSNTWTVLQNTPVPVGAGGSMAQSFYLNALLAFTGGGTSDFWSFPLGCNGGCTSGWQELPSAPGTVGPGGSLAGTNFGNLDSIIGLQGNGQSGFWLFSPNSNSWSVLPGIPAPVGNGGGISSLNDGTGHALAGGGSPQTWCFENIPNGPWTRQADLPVNIGSGGAITTQLAVGGAPNPGYTYVLQGSGSTAFFENPDFCPAQTQPPAAVPTATTITSSPNPSILGSPVTFNATVSPRNATGTIVFEDSNATIDTMPLLSGEAIFTTSTLSAGSHKITAVYEGNSTFLPSNGTLIQLVLGPTSGKATGGGHMGKGVNFGFDAMSKDGRTFKGHLEYHDRNAHINIDSTKITFLNVDSSLENATFAGQAMINDIHGNDKKNSTPAFTFIVRMTDPDKTGKHDTLSIMLTNSTGNVIYQNSGTVQGHIEIHNDDNGAHHHGDFNNSHGHNSTGPSGFLIGDGGNGGNGK